MNLTIALASWSAAVLCRFSETLSVFIRGQTSLYKFRGHRCLFNGSTQINVKTTAKFAGFLTLVVGLAAGGCSQKSFTSWKYIQDPGLAEQLKAFVAEKETLANADTNPMPKEFKRFFAAAKRGDWLAVSNIYLNIINENTNRRSVSGVTMGEIYGTFDTFAEGGEKYSVLYGNDIIQSVPPGSIYLPWGGPGYSIVAAMQKSQGQGDPFFTLSRPALNEYDYLRSMYGGKIYAPTYEDAQHCLDEYFAEIQSRMNDRPVARYHDTPDDIWSMERMLTKLVFDKNINHEFYIEGISWEWMYPLLEPHGLILKLNRQPLPALSDEMIQRDRNYWQKTASPLIGGWVNDDTFVTNIAAFAEKVFIRHDFAGFDGDTNFVQNTFAARMFSDDRVHIAELYAWRMEHAANASEKQRMHREADFAFRQAWALCPSAPGTVFEYTKFLSAEGRLPEAILVAETAKQFHDANEDEMGYLINQLERNPDSNNISATRLKEMEDETRVHPSNYTNIFSLAAAFMELQQTNNAAAVFEAAISRQGIPIDVIRGVANFFAQSGQFYELEKTLKRLTEVEPQAPEAWYDLSRLEVILGKKDEAIKNLQKAIELSDQRLNTNPSALNIRNAARAETQFNSIRNEPAFQKLVEP